MIQPLRKIHRRVFASPYPTLLSSPHAANASPSRYLLVAKGKHGLSQVAAYVGRSVRLRGTLIYRDDQKMIALSGGSIAVLGDPRQNQVAPKNLGEFDLVGEIAAAFPPFSRRLTSTALLRCTY